MLTKLEVKNAIVEAMKEFGAQVNFSKEDGLSWITVSGGSVTPIEFAKISQKIANSTDYDFYFSIATSNSIKGPIDAIMDNSINDFSVPERYSESKSDIIESYGQKFSSICTKKLKNQL